jgi:hypothetical protein
MALLYGRSGRLTTKNGGFRPGQMPSWMYKGGYCPDPKGCLPDYPWNTTDPFSAYSGGRELVDKTCGSMARYMGRLVGHYTSGGHFDECGHWHPSGFNYTWFGLSVLNEDEHGIEPDDGTAYTACYDAIMAEVRNPKNGNNPTIVGVGPEIAGTSGHATEYLMHFLDPKNHKGYNGAGANVAPAVSSYHWGSSASAPAESPAGGEAFLNDWEKTLADPAGTVQKVQAYKAKTGQKTEMVLNEYIPFVGDWCDVTNEELAPGGKCPNWQDPTVRARPGRLSALSVFLLKSILYGAFVWARRVLNRQKRRFPARADLGRQPRLAPREGPRHQPQDVVLRAQQIGGSGGSLEPPGPLS